MTHDGSTASSRSLPSARTHLRVLARRLARALALAPGSVDAFVEGTLPGFAEAHAALFALASHARRAGAGSIDAVLLGNSLRVALGLPDGTALPLPPPRIVSLVQRAFGVPLALEAGTLVTIPGPDGSAPAQAAIASLALAWLARVRALELEALADEDPEGVHQLRVAARRLREVLRALDRASADSATVQRLMATARAVARAGGLVRDLDVAQTVVRDRVGAATARDEALGRLASVRTTRLKRLRAALTGDAHEGRMTRLRDALERLVIAPPTDARSASDVLRSATARELSKVGHRLGEDMTAEGAYHEVRRRARRVRDAVELYGDALRKGQRAWRRRLHPVQAALGSMNDVDVTMSLLPTTFDAARERLKARRLELLAELATPLALLAVALRFDEG